MFEDKGLLVMDQDFEGTVKGFRKGGRKKLGREEMDPRNMATPRGLQPLGNSGHAHLGQQRAPNARSEDPGPNHPGRQSLTPAVAPGMNQTLPSSCRADREAGKSTAFCDETSEEIVTQRRDRLGGMGAQLMGTASRQASERRQFRICGPPLMRRHSQGAVYGLAGGIRILGQSDRRLVFNVS